MWVIELDDEVWTVEKLPKFRPNFESNFLIDDDDAD
jgi:hypothetical protein